MRDKGQQLELNIDGLEPSGEEAPAGQRNVKGQIKKILPEDRTVHDWYRFVLSFPPHLVRDVLQRFGMCGQHQVLDPFCGTGTTLVECKKLGIPSVGTEANPMAHFASQVKVDWNPDPDGLVEHAVEVAKAASAEMESGGVSEDPILCLERRAPYLLRTLPPESEKLLLTGSISPLPLHKTLILRDCLKEHCDARFYRHELLALARALVSDISNLHFGPEVGVGPARSDAPVIASWLTRVHAMADDLRALRHRSDVPAKVYLADCRKVLQNVGTSFD